MKKQGCVWWWQSRSSSASRVADAEESKSLPCGEQAAFHLKAERMHRKLAKMRGCNQAHSYKLADHHAAEAERLLAEEEAEGLAAQGAA